MNTKQPRPRSLLKSRSYAVVVAPAIFNGKFYQQNGPGRVHDHGSKSGMEQVARLNGGAAAGYFVYFHGGAWSLGDIVGKAAQ